MSGLLSSAAAAPPILRPYQVEAVEKVERAFADGSRSPLLALATGAGKTVIAGEIIRRWDGNVLFLAPRRELVFQCSAALSQAGVDHGVFMAGAEDLENAWADVTVASIDTAMVRILKAGRRPFPDPTLIIVDEAHLSITERRQALLSLWPEARLLGLTATPSRKDGKALGVIYDKLIEIVSVGELTRLEYLVPARYFSLSQPDLYHVTTQASEYHLGELDQAVNQPRLVADIVETWLQRAGGRRTAVFATSIAHAIALADEFQRAGVAAEHVSAKTALGERAEIFERFAAGRTQVITNCFLMSYGLDLPEMSCVVLARPTKSLVLFLQMLGRGLRPAEGKSDCLVLDHSGAVHRHGFAAEERLWTLEGEYALEAPRKIPSEETESQQITCPECSAVFSGTRTCPECGYTLKPKGRAVTTLDGNLIEIGTGLPEAEIDRRQFHAELRGLGIEKVYKGGWAAHQFKARFDVFPPFEWNDLPALEPTLQTRRWVKSRRIAWAKSQRRAS